VGSSCDFVLSLNRSIIGNLVNWIFGELKDKCRAQIAFTHIDTSLRVHLFDDSKQEVMWSIK